MSCKREKSNSSSQATFKVTAFLYFLGCFLALTCFSKQIKASYQYPAAAELHDLLIGSVLHSEESYNPCDG